MGLESFSSECADITPASVRRPARWVAGSDAAWKAFSGSPALSSRRTGTWVSSSAPSPARPRWRAVARRTGSPDHDYYGESKQRLGANRACLAIARKLLKRAHHTLRELGEEALQPA